MITQAMVDTMKSGSVVVDLAAEAGGNVAATVADKKIVTLNGVTCIGYTDLVSRLPTTSSNLYANNAQKFLESVGPQTTKEKGYWHVDHEDEAVRGMLVLEKGEVREGWSEATTSKARSSWSAASTASPPLKRTFNSSLRSSPMSNISLRRFAPPDRSLVADEVACPPPSATSCTHSGGARQEGRGRGDC